MDDELPAGRPHHLHLHEREALVEGLDDFLFGLGEVGRVIDHPAFFLGRFDQFVAAIGLRVGALAADGHRGKTRGRADSELPAVDAKFTHAFLPRTFLMT